MLRYLRRFYHEAKNKLTTYVALATASLTEITSNWDQTAALLPPWVLQHKQHIFAACTLAMIWTRVRRNLQIPDEK